MLLKTFCLKRFDKTIVTKTGSGRPLVNSYNLCTATTCKSVVFPESRYFNAVRFKTKEEYELIKSDLTKLPVAERLTLINFHLKNEGFVYWFCKGFDEFLEKDKRINEVADSCKKG